MPRTVQDILDHAEELARRFESYEPAAADERDAQVFAALRDAALSRSNAEQAISAAVGDARQHGYSWAFIGSVLGTSGEAARQRYGTKQEVWRRSAQEPQVTEFAPEIIGVPPRTRSRVDRALGTPGHGAPAALPRYLRDLLAVALLLRTPW